MKKRLLLTLLSVGILVACSNDETKVVEDTSDQEDTSKGIEVDKGLLNVEVTLPAAILEGQDS